MRLLDRVQNAWKALRGAPGVYGTGGGVQQAGLANRSDLSELLKGYHSWVFACVNLISNSVAQVPMRLYVRRGDGREEVQDHPVLELFDQVNPVQTRFELWKLTVVWLELCGKAYWYVAKNQLGRPQELWPVQPERMQIVPDRERLIGGYLYRHGAQKIEFKADEIVYLRYPHPGSIYEGQSTLQAAAYAYDTDKFMKQYRIHTFQNRGRPDVTLQTDQWLEEGTITRMRAEWDKTYGSVSNASKVAILVGGLEAKPFSLTPADLDFLEGIRPTRDEILSIFGVPASKLGLVEDVNRANAEANDLTFQSEAVLPRLRMIDEKVNQDLIPMFDSKLEIEHDSPVPQDWERRLKERENRLKLWYSSVNEERERDGGDPVPWGNVPLAPLNIMPLGAIGDYGGKASAALAKAQRTQREATTGANALIEDERRTALWLDFVARQAPVERGLEWTVRGLFEEQRKVVQSNLKKVMGTAGIQRRDDLVDFIVFPLDEAVEQWQKAGKGHIREAVEKGIARGAEELGVDPFEIGPYPSVSRFIDEKTFKFSFEANETTLGQLRGELNEGLAAGETTKELAARVDKVFDFGSQTRSLTIARTETSGAMNYGTLEEYKQSGIAVKKQWLTARDGAVRDSHKAMDGQTVELEEPFITGLGNAMMYPGDSNAPAEEVVNERCSVLSVKKEE